VRATDVPVPAILSCGRVALGSSATLMLSTACPHPRVDRFRFLYTNATAAATQTGYAAVSIGAPILRRETRESARFFSSKFECPLTPPPLTAPGFRTHLSTVFFNRTRPRVKPACEWSYRIIDNSPHRLSTAMTRSYGKLYYCALNQCILGSRSLRFATSASRRSLPHRQRVSTNATRQLCHATRTTRRSAAYSAARRPYRGRALGRLLVR
jgi:hypothetical protein